MGRYFRRPSAWLSGALVCAMASCATETWLGGRSPNSAGWSLLVDPAGTRRTSDGTDAVFWLGIRNESAQDRVICGHPDGGYKLRTARSFRSALPFSSLGCGAIQMRHLLRPGRALYFLQEVPIETGDRTDKIEFWVRGVELSANGLVEVADLEFRRMYPDWARSVPRRVSVDEKSAWSVDVKPLGVLKTSIWGKGMWYWVGVHNGLKRPRGICSYVRIRFAVRKGDALLKEGGDELPLECVEKIWRLVPAGDTYYVLFELPLDDVDVGAERAILNIKSPEMSEDARILPSAMELEWVDSDFGSRLRAGVKTRHAGTPQ